MTKWIQEIKAEVKQNLKKEFPKFKFSVTAPDHNVLKVAILKTDIFETTEYSEVNRFWIQENYEGEQKDFLLKVKEIAGAKLRVIDENPDYGSIPNFYLSMSIGNYGKPHMNIAA
jgi:hypothetical protein